MKMTRNCISTKSCNIVYGCDAIPGLPGFYVSIHHKDGRDHHYDTRPIGQFDHTCMELPGGTEEDRGMHNAPATTKEALARLMRRIVGKPVRF
jgi:hypothetical protein